MLRKTYKITKVEASGSLGIVSDEGINEKSISKVPTIFNLHGEDLL